MFKKTTIALALALLLVAPSAIANVGGWPPFPAQSILWYQIFAPGADVACTFVGAAQGVEQGGGHDDCWYESAVAALARYPSDPRLLSDMIQQSTNDGYKVTFLDKPDTSYAVTQADVTKYHIKDNASWADILEAGLFERFPALLNGQTGDNVVHLNLSAFKQGPSRPQVTRAKVCARRLISGVGQRALGFKRLNARKNNHGPMFINNYGGTCGDFYRLAASRQCRRHRQTTDERAESLM